ncbi:MAG TPA: FAD-dependent oxidoreductase [Bacteroidales bacterium]|nr:FAD-dependent oxidoreductase [Bacteroidales bacterium]
MEKIYDTIIWGASLRGLEKALELQKQGNDVLVVNKFGFPGGNLTEALSCLTGDGFFTGSSFRERLRARLSELNFGVVSNQNNELILHPEAVKRASWEQITANGLQVIFHLTPLQVNKNGEITELTVFGREGTFTLRTHELLDLSDNRLLTGLEGQPSYQDRIRINCFFKDMNPEMENHFGFQRVEETSVGYFAVFQKDQVHWADVERHFNITLDELAVEGWKKFGVRMLIMPVYPELVLKEQARK